ncbi:unnamed protein product [Agarophyton chilense]
MQSSTQSLKPSSRPTQPVAWFAQPVSVGNAIVETIEEEPIPEGPLPFPRVQENGDTVNVHAGSSWIPSFASTMLPALPSHWLIETVPKTKVRERSSIFTALQRGGWIGCERPFHLVCKGVYRAIKVTNAINVVNIGCERDAAWLPHIVKKLREEFRMVKLTCIGEHSDGFEDVDVRFVKMDVFEERFPNETDMLVAYKFVETRTLISAMKFLKNVKRSDSVQTLVIETFPDSDNSIRDGLLKMNTAIAPFWFPTALYQYSNEEENEEKQAMKIIAVTVNQLFTDRNTPSMMDLVDPRKRLVQE